MNPRAIHAGNAGPFTLDGTRTFLVGRDRVVVIDPGPDLETHHRVLVEALADARSVSIVVTHWHGDHSALASRLAAGLGDLPIHGPGALADVPLVRGDRLESDDGPLVAIPTPGHARDHLALYHEGSGSLFVGDLLLGQGDTTWVGEYRESVGDYLASLAAVRELDPRVMYPTHGPPITDVPRALDRYEAHRRQRIAQVEQALATVSAGDLDGLLEAVYGSVAAGLDDAARMSLQATLHYLGVDT